MLFLYLHPTFTSLTLELCKLPWASSALIIGAFSRMYLLEPLNICFVHLGMIADSDPSPYKALFSIPWPLPSELSKDAVPGVYYLFRLFRNRWERK
jgi:hypothetical protein